MFGIGGFELFLILIFGFLIFGPDKLPAIAQTIGRAIAKFRGAQENMSEQLKSATFVDKDSDEPLKNPLEVIENAAKNAKGAASDAQKKAEEVADAAVSGAAAAGNAVGAQAREHAESFAERKARYDRERAARKAAEAQQAASGGAGSDDVAQAVAGEDSERDPKADIAKKSVGDADAASEEVA